ncbi:MAG: ubiquinol-cytochrome c reductase iron-sulfur subunit [Pseudomonadales bacterium]|nr:ubiquinol-cytochrome c reductase iron-sulfur subunit [Pseudomonadales bacterium]
MSNDGVNNSRRRFLAASTAAVGAVGAGAVAVPFIGSWLPSAKAKAAGAPVRADLSKVPAGLMMTIEWRGQPVYVLNRTPEQLKNLKMLDDELKDPASETAKQPAYIEGQERSVKPNLGIYVGLCTHLGCAPKFRPEVAPADLGPRWVGGFFCPCHGSKFDLAGRVLKGSPAPTNLVIPPHKYITDTVVIIGEDGGAA